MARAEFVPGLDLAGMLYQQVKPVIEGHWPALRWGAARWGRGSEVLGYDTPRSMDHDWGPRLQVYLAGADAALAAPLRECLARELPMRCGGFPNHFERAPGEPSRLMGTPRRPLRHGVFIETLAAFTDRYLGVTPAGPQTATQWLVIPSQKLRGIVSGRVFRDDEGALTELARRLSWYPDPLWHYLLLAGLQRIDQEAPFAPRCFENGDLLGQRLVLQGLAEDLISLAFLIERVHRPYSKWVGRAFADLNIAAELGPQLIQMLEEAAPGRQLELWQQACLTVLRAFNGLDVAPAMPEAFVQFHDRPYEVPALTAIEALQQQLSGDNQVGTRAGAIWQWVRSTDVLDRTESCRALQKLWEP